MNNKRMRFGLLVLAIYAALGVIGISSRGTDGSPATELAALAKSAGTVHSGDAGAAEASVEWHSFLPGAFK